MRIEDIGEAGLIERIRKLVATRDDQVVVAVGDDAAVTIPIIGHFDVLTTDMLVEGVHFKLPLITPFQLGYKSIVVNVSDVAAMAGFPRFALVSLGLRSGMSVNFVEQLYLGMMEAAGEYRLSIIGGDITRATRLTLSVFILGEVEVEMLCRRATAHIGDKILVTGYLGASAAGLQLLLHTELEKTVPKHKEKLKRAHLMPLARVKEARAAATHGVHAMEDISDGLASEITHICQESEVGARLYLEDIPIALGVREVAKAAGMSPEDLALYGGEDYELVFTVPAHRSRDMARRVSQETKTAVTLVGDIVREEEGIVLVGREGVISPLEMGYDHFKMAKSKRKK